jgi:photosystem II stability/assembly factor-like uncharacterized protein
MELQEPEPWQEAPSEASHARRAAAVIAVSMVAIAATAVAYLHPSGPVAAPATTIAIPAAPAGYQVAAVDFVDPSTGWVVGLLDSGDFTILQTSDGGGHWTRQLSHPTGGHETYLRFFDQEHGMVALVGSRPLIYRTADGGRTWQQQISFNASAFVQSISFVNPDDGWMLIRQSTENQPLSRLFRTRDGGSTWSDLGEPTAAPDLAYGVQFADRATGWLDSQSGGAYVYRSVDGGTSWQQVALPAPRAGWPATGQFFVSARPTRGTGVVATVVNFPPAVGRSGQGATITWFPPLTVRAYDGGAAVSYTYATLSSRLSIGPSAQSEAPNAVEMGSLDAGASWSALAPPAAAGAIAYTNERNLWWIGLGEWSKSSDGGATWTPHRGLGVPQPLPGSLQILDPRHAWFAAMTGTRPVLESTADAGINWRMVLLPMMNTGDFNPAG